MSSFTIVIRAAPYTSQGALTAYHFARAVLDCGHSIYRLFFYQDGVYNASNQIVPPQDELHLPAAWQQLITTHELDAVVCIGSALKRGILDDKEAQRYDLAVGTLLPGFTISGLGQLVDAGMSCDRVVCFAP